MMRYYHCFYYECYSCWYCYCDQCYYCGSALLVQDFAASARTLSHPLYSFLSAQDLADTAAPTVP